MKEKRKSRNHGQKAGGVKLWGGSPSGQTDAGGNNASHAPKAAAAGSAHSNTDICWPCLSPWVPSTLLSMDSVLPARSKRGTGHPDGRSEARQAMLELALPTRPPAAASGSPWKPPREHCLCTRATRVFSDGPEVICTRGLVE